MKVTLTEVKRFDYKKNGEDKHGFDLRFADGSKGVLFKDDGAEVARGLIGKEFDWEFEPADGDKAPFVKSIGDLWPKRKGGWGGSAPKATVEELAVRFSVDVHAALLATGDGTAAVSSLVESVLREAAAIRGFLAGGAVSPPASSAPSSQQPADGEAVVAAGALCPHGAKSVTACVLCRKAAKAS